MTEDITRDYLNQIARYPLLTPTQEIQLSRQVQEMLAVTSEHPSKAEQRIIRRGRKARDTLINCNLRLVVYVAKRYIKRLNGNSMELLDIIQEGAFGLQRAAEKFDPARGYRFSTYSYWWIRQAIIRSIDMQERVIRLPVQKLELIHAALRYRTECIRAGGNASIADMAAHINVSTDELSMLLNRYASARSLDEVCGDNTSTTLMEMIADEHSVTTELQDVIQQEQMQLAFFRLNEQDRSILCERYGLHNNEPKTYQAIANEDKVSRERIRQRVTIAERRLRAVMVTQRLAAEPDCVPSTCH